MGHRLSTSFKDLLPLTTIVNLTPFWFVKVFSLTSHPFASRRQAPWLSVVVMMESKTISVGGLASSLAYALT